MSRTVHILWAEDEKTAFDAYSSTLELFLERHGLACRFSYAMNGGEAMGMLTQERPDVFLTDLRMPRFHGLDVIPKVHEQWPDLPIIVISTLTHEEEVAAALERMKRAHRIQGYFSATASTAYCAAVLEALTVRAPTLLHISDLHFGRVHAFNGAALEKSIRNAMPSIQRDGKIDLILVSGDSAESGEDWEFEQAKEFLIFLAAQCGLGLDRIVIVAGNHDIQRGARPETRFGNYVDFLLSLYGGLANPNEVYRSYPKLFDSKKNMILPAARKCRPDDLFTISIFNELQTIVVGMNSVVSVDGEFDFGRVSAEQLMDASHELSQLDKPQRDYLRIAMFHHNLLPVPNFRNDGSPERIVRNATLVLHHLIDGGFDLLFHGHTHTSLVYQYMPILMDSARWSAEPIHVVGTGTLASAEADPTQHYFHMTTMRCGQRETGHTRSAMVQSYRLFESATRWQAGGAAKIKFGSRGHRTAGNSAGGGDA